LFKVRSENRNKAKEQKEPVLSFDVFKVERGESKRGRLPHDLKAKSRTEKEKLENSWLSSRLVHKNSILKL